MDPQTPTLTDLISKGKAQGFLTYDNVTSYLPDEDIGAEPVDQLLVALEDHGVELLSKPPASRAGLAAIAELEQENEEDLVPTLELTPLEVTRGNQDPIRMYLTQMAEIPLLEREEEIALAKKIEITRRSFRRELLSCGYALQATITNARKSASWRFAIRSHD